MTDDDKLKKVREIGHNIITLTMKEGIEAGLDPSDCTAAVMAAAASAASALFRNARTHAQKTDAFRRMTPMFGKMLADGLNANGGDQINVACVFAKASDLGLEDDEAPDNSGSPFGPN